MNYQLRVAIFLSLIVCSSKAYTQGFSYSAIDTNHLVEWWELEDNPKFNLKNIILNNNISERDSVFYGRLYLTDADSVVIRNFSSFKNLRAISITFYINDTTLINTLLDKLLLCKKLNNICINISTRAASKLLGRYFQKNKQIEKLTLRYAWNRDIPAYLEGYSGLKSLKIFDDSIRHISSRIGSLSNLEILEIISSTRGNISISDDICRLTKLKRVGIYHDVVFYECSNRYPIVYDSFFINKMDCQPFAFRFEDGPNLLFKWLPEGLQKHLKDTYEIYGSRAVHIDCRDKRIVDLPYFNDAGIHALCLDRINNAHALDLVSRMDRLSYLQLANVELGYGELLQLLKRMKKMRNLEDIYFSTKNKLALDYKILSYFTHLRHYDINIYMNKKIYSQKKIGRLFPGSRIRVVEDDGELMLLEISRYY